MEQKVETLLKSILHDKKFPPTERINEIKAERAAKGGFFSGETVKMLAQAYIESVEQVMNEFVAQILRNADKLNLTSEEKIWSEVNEGFQKLKADAAVSIPQNAG